MTFFLLNFIFLPLHECWQYIVCWDFNFLYTFLRIQIVCEDLRVEPEVNEIKLQFIVLKKLKEKESK